MKKAPVWRFFCGGRSGNVRFQHEATAAVFAAEGLQRGQHGFQFGGQGVRRVDEEHSAAVHPVRAACRADVQLGAQVVVAKLAHQFGGEMAAFRARQAGIPDEVAAAGKAFVRSGEGGEGGPERPGRLGWSGQRGWPGAARAARVARSG